LEDWKIKIALLWLIYGGANLVSAIISAFEPGVLKEFLEKGTIGGETLGPEMLLVLAVFLLVPLVIAFLPLTLKDSTNRWTNIILGMVFAVFGLIAPVEYLAKQSAYSAYIILIAIVQVVAAALIVWYAWKSKQKA